MGMQGVETKVDFEVSNGVHHDAIIGMEWLAQMDAKVGCHDCSMIGTLFDGSPFCLTSMKPFPNTPLLSSTQVKIGLRKGDQYYWVSVHENLKGNQKFNTITMGVRNNIKILLGFLTHVIHPSKCIL
jgi:hypothetical protein